MKVFPGFAIFTTAFALLHLPAAAQQAGSRPITRERVLGRAASQFNAMDTNKDGKLDQTEMAAFIDAELAKLRARLQQRFEDGDTGGKGYVTKQEFIAAREKWFSDVDANGDGTLDANELREWNRKRRAK